MEETILHIEGNLTAAPELRFTPSGAAVANFTVASTPRKRDKNTGDYVDGETLFMRCAAWRELAENISESLTKGNRVMVKGELKSRSYETKEGERRTVQELEVYEIGASLKYAVVDKITKNTRGQGNSNFTQNQGHGQGAQQRSHQNQRQGQEQGYDVWNTATPGGGADQNWPEPENNEPPF